MTTGGGFNFRPVLPVKLNCKLLIKMESMELESNLVQVIVMMTGGHQYELSLSADAPLLQELFQALSNRGKNAGKDMFKIPNEEDGSCLYIPRDAIAAIATVPPIAIQTLNLEPQSPQVELSPPPPKPPEIIESSFVQLDNFLNSPEYQQLIETIFPQELAIASSGIQLPTPQSFAPLREVLLHRVQRMFPDVLIQLGMQGFPLREMEAQDIPIHAIEGQPISTDANSSETALRVLSFMYFFYQEPRPFTGGELRIYDSQIQNKYLSAAQSYKTIEPRNNSIVFFLASNAYEVLPVHPNSPAFRDRCFRVQGWMRRSG